MPRQPIHSDRAPAAIGPYSQAVRRGETVFLSGQIALDPDTGLLVEGDIEVQARRAAATRRRWSSAPGTALRSNPTSPR